MIALAVATALTGCGSAVDDETQSPGGGRGEAETTTGRDEHQEPQVVGQELGSGGGVFFLTPVGDVGLPGGEGRSIKKLYRVFSRPKNAGDEEAAEIAARWGALDIGVDEETDLDRPPGISEEQWRVMRPGELLTEQGRLLLRGLGGEEDMIYAAPTANDHICVELLPNGGGGCGSPGPDGLDLYWTYTPRESLVVYGLVSDEITSVDVLIAGETYVARMGENAFGVRVGGAQARGPDTVVLHRRDGTRRTIPLRPPWGEVSFRSSGD